MNRWPKALTVAVVLLSFTLVPATSLAADLDQLDALLKEIATYDFGQSRENLTKISDIIRDTANSSPGDLKSIEGKLAEFVRGDATYAAKQFVCKELSLIGTEQSVAALAPMLTDEQFSDMARYALERIPGESVDEALREALAKAKGKPKVGIINTLAVRGDTKAVPTLIELIDDPGPMVASAAIAALGSINGPDAAKALGDAKDRLKDPLKTTALEAYLKCADSFAAKAQKEKAMEIYSQLCDSAQPLPIRIAALRGKVTNADNTTGIVVEVLKSDDQPMQTAVIGLLRDVANTEMIKAVAPMLDDLSLTSRVQLLSALADCGDKAALDAVVAEVQSQEPASRIAALTALGTLGGASNVDMLVDIAATATGDEQQAARDSLYRLRGEDVDQAIVQKIPDAQAKQKAELVRALDQRNITAAVPTVLKVVADSEPRVGVEAIKALRTIASPDNLSDIIDLLIKATGSTERTELERTVVAVARKIPDEQKQSDLVLEKLDSVEETAAKGSLLAVLGRLGNDSALPVLLDALKSTDDKIKDAAIRALSEWPNGTPAPNLLEVAKTSENQTHKILALRGYVRLIGLESDRAPEETIKMYKEAMALAPNVNEKRAVLSGLANVESLEALQMAEGYLDDAELAPEAESAIIKITENTDERYPEETKAVLQKVLGQTKNEEVRRQAQWRLRRLERN